MHTLGLAFALVGLNTAWIPGFGWIGVALALAGSLLGVRSVSDRESRILATILGTCALFFGTAGLAFGLGVQLKHAAPVLDPVLLPLPWTHAALGAAGAALVAIGALLLARFKARAAGVVLVLLSLVAFHACASSALVGADREMTGAAASGRETTATSATPGTAL